MSEILLSPFFLLFCAATGLAAFVAHYVCVLDIAPSAADRVATIVAALISTKLSYLVYGMQIGVYRPIGIDVATATWIAVLAALGAAYISAQVALADRRTVSAFSSY